MLIKLKKTTISDSTKKRRESKLNNKQTNISFIAEISFFIFENKMRIIIYYVHQLERFQI
jgi:hypothetical protein